MLHIGMGCLEWKYPEIYQSRPGQAIIDNRWLVPSVYISRGNSGTLPHIFNIAQKIVKPGGLQDNIIDPKQNINRHLC